MANGETTVEKRIRGIETTCAAQLTKFATLKKDLDDHENRLREIEKLAPALRAVMWVGAVLGVSVVGLIWAMITGQVSIHFN